MDALERYYQEYLLGYSQDANFGTYDVDMQMTKDRIENILQRGYIENDEIEYIRSLLSDIENDNIRTALEYYIETL
jgi:hypothetical protein